MLIYVTAIGRGITLKYPIGKKDYDGIIGIVEESTIFGKKYKTTKNIEIEQDIKFKAIYDNTDFKIHDLIIIPPKLNLYDMGKLILDNIIDKIRTYNNIKFHIELSQGYKELPHILMLISQIFPKNINKITFTRYDNSEQRFPISKIKLTKNQLEVLREFQKGMKCTHWNNKIVTNPYIHNSDKHKKYIYKVLKDAKEQGYMSKDNNFTDFGKLILEYYN